MESSLRRRSETMFDRRAILVHTCNSAFICFWLRYYFGATEVDSVDLPGHIAAINQLRGRLLSGSLFFYDHLRFTGWPVYEFYAPLAHLIAAIISYPLELLTDQPVQRAVHLLMVVGAAMLAPCLHYAAWPYVTSLKGVSREDDSSHKEMPVQCLVAIISATVAFWFLNNNSSPNNAVGFAGPFSLGLFTQLFGWLGLLLFFGALTRLLQEPSLRHERMVVVWFSCVFLTHSLTAVYALCLAVFCWLWFENARWRLARALVLALLVCSFWLLPSTVHGSSMRLNQLLDSGIDFFDILARYPFISLVETFSAWLGGQSTFLDVASLTIPLLLPAAFLVRKIRESSLLLPMLIIILLLQMVSASKLTVQSFPIEIHWYRFAPFSFLIMLAVIGSVPFVWIFSGEKPKQGMRIAALVFVTMYCSVALMPCGAYQDQLRQFEKTKLYEPHYKVIDYFAKIREPGRILFEYTQDGVAAGTSHFLPLMLPELTAHESANGLFIQSSLASTIVGTYARLLELDIFGYGAQFAHDADRYNTLSVGAIVEQIRRLGVTHIVAARKESSENLREVLRQFPGFVEPVTHEPFTIFQLQTSFIPVETVTKRLVGFIDLAGTLPFKLMEFYVEGNVLLHSNIELLDLTGERSFPAQLDTVIVNTREDQNMVPKAALQALGVEGTSSVNVVLTHFQPDRLSSHYDVKGARTDEGAYVLLSEYMATKVLLANQLNVRFGPAQRQAEKVAPSLQWSSDGGSLFLSNLRPGELVRINYSYFPYWSSPHGEVFRGSGERMFLLPRSESATLSYQRTTATVVVLGYLLSAIGALIVIVVYRPSKRNG